MYTVQRRVEGLYFPKLDLDKTYVYMSPDVHGFRGGWRGCISPNLGGFREGLVVTWGLFALPDAH